MLTDTERFVADRKTAEDVRELVGRLVDVKALRGMSTGEISSVSGLDYETVYNFEMWPHDPRLSLILKYAKAVGIKLDIKMSDSECFDD